MPSVYNSCVLMHGLTQKLNESRGLSSFSFLLSSHLSAGVTLSSDFMSGFCGETEEEHRDTLSLLQEVGYDMAYMFAYSMRQVRSSRHCCVHWSVNCVGVDLLFVSSLHPISPPPPPPPPTLLPIFSIPSMFPCFLVSLPVFAEDPCLSPHAR